MPLSPQEERALASLEEGLRADDPALAAVLGTAAPARPSIVALAPWRVLALLAALGGVIAAGVLAGDRPAVLAPVTGALLVPWLVTTARAARRPSSGRRRAWRWRRAPGTSRSEGALPFGYGTLAVAAAVLLVIVALVPPVARAMIGLVVVFVVAPWCAVHVMTWIDRRRSG